MAEKIILNISIILFGILFYKKIRHGLHMLQLESYYNDRYFRWMKKNIKKVINPIEIIILLVPMRILAANQIVPAYIVEICLLILLILFTPKRKEKKAFVVTSRIKRTYGTFIILFLLIELILNLVNNMILGIILLNILLIIAYLFVPLVNIINYPIENKIRKCFLKKAKKKLEEMKEIEVVGITGSYGKTTTKNIVNAILSAKYNSVMTPESFNTPMGVVRTINENIKATDNIFVCEMGAKYVGDIKEICDIVKPKYAIITAIGPQHLETFKTLENVRKTKLELVEAIPNDGIAFVNWEDEEIRRSKINAKKIVRYGFNSKECDYYAKNITSNESGSHFTVIMPNKKEIKIKTKLLGKLNILNIVCGIAVADKLGLSETQMRMGVRFIKPVEHRLQIRKNANGNIIIDDAYNSNVKGAQMALDVLKSFKGKTRILVTPGIVELGDKQEEINEDLGEKASKCADFIILVGEKQAQPILEGLKRKKYPEEQIFVAKNLQEGLTKLNEITVNKNSVILLENDLPDNYL